MNTKNSDVLSLLLTLMVISTVIALVGVMDNNNSSNSSAGDFSNTPTIPNDWLFRQRAYPNGKIDIEAYRHALAFKKENITNKRQRNTSVLDTTKWSFAGPTNVGGRVTDIEIADKTPFPIYIGTAAGGVFVSADEGNTWNPLFDDELNLSIGDIALAPSNNKVIYVGTGEPNGGGGSLTYDGYGVYKSLDGGLNWTNVGLNDVGSIGKVLVSPVDTNVCFVGAMGNLFKSGNNRGVYKTSDGGLTWDQMLFINDSTGIIDLAINPQDPEIVYAAAWQRVRTVDRRSYGGPSSGIYKSADGGVTWSKLENGLPSSAGRIGIAIAPSNPQIIYSNFVDGNSGHLIGLYKTDNGGDSWEEKNSLDISDAPYMYWFGLIDIDKDDPNTVYVPGFHMYKSIDGAENWERIFSGAHVDQHAIARHPQNTDMLIAGNDGGIYISEDNGVAHTKSNGIPITQFYTCEIDNSFPEKLYGGAQDNGTVRTLTGELDDWERINGGDGFKVLVDPGDNNFVYAESQYGVLSRSIDGGNSFGNAMNGIDGNDRKNWNTPVVFNPNNSTELYYGSNHLYRSTDNAESWAVISPDLTTNPAQNNLVYGTITTISVSPIEEDIIYVGTDDGIAQVTTNGGNDWTNVSASLPNRWVTSITADAMDATTAYITLSGYRYGTDSGHIYKTTDLGGNWLDISGDLPDIPINDFIKVPSTGYLYIATDIGVLYSVNSGLNWELLGLGIPNVVITDICYHESENFLIAASYGRGMFKISLDEQVVSTVDEENVDDLKLIAYPNPFAENVQLSFNAPKNQIYTIDVHNVSGKKMQTIYSGYLNQGQQNFDIDAGMFPPGLYICTITAENKRSQINLIKH